MGSVSYERFAGACGIAAGVGGLAYSASFVTYLHNGSLTAAKIATVLLLLGGLVIVAVAVGAFQRLQAVDRSFALLAVALGTAAGAGSAIHGAYDLANFLHSPGVSTGNLPNAVDPRGLMTFGVSGLSILLFAWLIVRGCAMTKALGYVGVLAG